MIDPTLCLRILLLEVSGNAIQDEVEGGGEGGGADCSMRWGGGVTAIMCAPFIHMRGVAFSSI